MAVYKEINRADGSGVTTFYRISDVLDTAETDDQEGQAVIVDYNQAQNKPSINGVTLIGNKTSEDLGLQPAGDYITNDEADEKFIDEDELEAKNYVNQTELQDAIAHIEHFHREIVEALPVTGMDNVLYMVRKGGTGEDIYNEYIWVGLSSSEDGYEFLGTTATDLTDYYKKSQVDAALATKVDKEGGKGLSEQNYTLAEKTKLAGLENYDDTEIQADVAGLSNNVSSISTNTVALNNRVATIEPKVETNSTAVTTIYDLLDKKMTAIRLVEQGDGWVWMNLEGSRLTYAQASAALGHENCMLFIEQLENDGKVIPAEYKSEGDHINVIFKDLDSLVHIMTCGEDDAIVTHSITMVNGVINFTVEDEAVGYGTTLDAIYGDTKQQTYPGKQFTNLDNLRTTTGSLITLPYSVNGLRITRVEGTNSLKINGTATATTNIRVGIGNYDNTTHYNRTPNSVFNGRGNFRVMEITPAYVYVNDLVPTSTVTDFTIPEVSTSGNMVSLNITINNNSVWNNEMVDFYLVATTDMDYINDPYTGGPSPNPVYPQDVKVVKGKNTLRTSSKNLFDINLWRTTPPALAGGGGHITVTSDEITIDNPSGTDVYTISGMSGTIGAPIPENLRIYWIPVKPNTQYTFSFIKTSDTLDTASDDSSYFAFFDENFVTLSFSTLGAADFNEKYTKTVRTTADTRYIGFRLGVRRVASASITYKEFQIEEGSTYTNYEEYEGQTLVLNLGDIELCKINTHQDKIYKNNDIWYLHKETGKKVFDGVNGKVTMKHGTITSPTKGLYQAALPGKATRGNSGVTDKAISNNMPWLTGGAQSAFDNNDYGYWWEGGTTYIYVVIEATTVADANTWFTTHNSTVYYELATPTDTEITDQTLLAQLEALEQITQYKNTYISIIGTDLTPEADFTYISNIVINNSDNVLGKDTYWNDEVPTSADLPANAQEGEIRIVQDTEAVYIYDGNDWIPFDKGGEVDLSNYLAKDNTTAWIPTGPFNPATKKYVDDSVGAIHVPTKTSQLTNDSNFINKNANDLTNYYPKSNTYTKAEVDALIHSGGTGVQVVVVGDTLVITTVLPGGE